MLERFEVVVEEECASGWWNGNTAMDCLLEGADT